VSVLLLDRTTEVCVFLGFEGKYMSTCQFFGYVVFVGTVIPQVLMQGEKQVCTLVP
jgi:hypothetical protein